MIGINDTNATDILQINPSKNQLTEQLVFTVHWRANVCIMFGAKQSN